MPGQYVKTSDPFYAIQANEFKYLDLSSMFHARSDIADAKGIRPIDFYNTLTGGYSTPDVKRLNVPKPTFKTEQEARYVLSMFLDDCSIVQQELQEILTKDIEGATKKEIRYFQANLDKVNRLLKDCYIVELVTVKVTTEIEKL